MKKYVINIFFISFLVLTSILYKPFIDTKTKTELKDSCYNFIGANQLYLENLDTLSQPIFWRILMNMSHDSALINIGSTRQIIKKVSLLDWDKQTNLEKNIFRDSIRNFYSLNTKEKIYCTSGRKFFYDFNNVLPLISRGIKIFEDNNVDPFYAQAILLIESPNKLQKSNTGAYGSFQIMKSVAISMGLKVNQYQDERSDFDKSAWAAAKLIRTVCIPELNRILNSKSISYNTTDTWYRLMVMHVYHAGAGNVKKVVDVINPKTGDMNLIITMWQTEAGGFKNASQNYSQLVLASMFEMDNFSKN